MTVTAHSGAFDTPDNSIEYIRRVLDEGCGILEMDVSFRPDGTPVLIHKGRPADDEGIYLSSAFDLIAESQTLRMNLDLKSVSNLPAVDRMLRLFGLFDRAFFTGVGTRWVPAVRRHSDLPYYLNAGLPEKLRDHPVACALLARKIRALGAVGLNCHFTNATPTLARALHKRGLELSVWTVNEEADANRVLALDVDNVPSRHPDMILRVEAGRSPAGARGTEMKK